MEQHKTIQLLNGWSVKSVVCGFINHVPECKETMNTMSVEAVSQIVHLLNHDTSEP